MEKLTEKSTGETMKKTGLVLQGGGMRGVYTSGVLDYFMEKNLYFPYVAAVSAGASNASAYLARQQGFGKIMHVDYLHDPRFVGFRNLFTQRSLFGLDYILKEIPKKLNPFCYDRFFQADETFVVVTTDCRTGQSVYFNKHDHHEEGEEFFTAVKASCSLPFVSPIVKYKGMHLLDGGIADPIPIQKSISDGNEKHVIILTSEPVPTPAPPDKFKWLARTFYARHPKLVDALWEHHQIFNDTVKQIAELERSGRAIVIRPSKYIPTKGVERDKSKMLALYEQGYLDAMTAYPRLLAWTRPAGQDVMFGQ